MYIYLYNVVSSSTPSAARRAAAARGRSLRRHPRTLLDLRKATNPRAGDADGSAAEETSSQTASRSFNQAARQPGGPPGPDRRTGPSGTSGTSSACRRP